MNKIKTIFKYELFTTIKRKSFILMTLAFPLLGFLIIGGFSLIQGTDGETPIEEIRVGYVDEPGGFDNHLTYGNVTLIPQEGQQAAFDNMTEGIISQYFVIPENYMTTGNVTRYTLTRELDVSSQVYYAIERFLVNNILEGKVDSSIVDRVASPSSLLTITLIRSKFPGQSSARSSFPQSVSGTS
jgi:ABC-2 type transport system permease protein